MRRPNLFILGAARCGTSAMFEFLGAHPEIHPSRVKEPRYFDPTRNTRSLDEYLALFTAATDERWLVEATPTYISTPGAPQRIREFSAHARAIVLVRDPVDQMRSIHAFRVFLQREESADLRTELSLLKEGYWRNVRSGKNLSRVLGAFPREAVHVIVYDDFRADVGLAYRQTLDFLEIDPSFVPRFRIVNPTSTPRSRTLQAMLWRDGGPLRAVARAVLPDRMRKKAFHFAASLNRRPEAVPPIDPGLAAELWRELEPDVELLSRLLDRDLVALWRR